MANDMDAYLEHVLEVENDDMRDLILNNGFNNVTKLVRAKSDFVSKMCSIIRKSGHGDAEARAITMELERYLQMLQWFLKYCYLTNREVTLNEASLDRLEEVSNWQQLLPTEAPDDSVPKFKETLNLKTWFESIENHLRLKVGPSGVPLLYTIREDGLMNRVAFEAIDDFDEDMATFGRLSGYYWQADNRALWQYIQNKTHGTTAWSVVQPCKPNQNGRTAYRLLKAEHLGEDVFELLRREAENTLSKSRYDGTSRNYTFAKHCSIFREALINMGPEDQYSEPRKVSTFMNTFQVAALKHLDATVSSTPGLRNNLEATISFIGTQLASLKLKNGASQSTRSVAAVTTTDTADKTESKASLKRKLAALQNQVKQLQENKERAAHSRYSRSNGKGGKITNKSDTFDPKNPAAFLPKHAFNKLTDEEKKLVLEARRKAGIPTKRSVGSMDTTPTDTAASPAAVNSPTVMPGVSPALITPTPKKLNLTQRSTTYSSSTDSAKKVRFNPNK